ncbi:hypothetical protein E2C01_048732 [Portunus trituberculatus]|uniref:Uncharacterized protein n=1 Tax=Portunus trituberculatus TaxID=210409 RepID=A0A5B7GBB6_PORTR|nr:hypothetical protein [Portunus trituberculatus]
MKHWAMRTLPEHVKVRSNLQQAKHSSTEAPFTSPYMIHHVPHTNLASRPAPPRQAMMWTSP